MARLRRSNGQGSAAELSTSVAPAVVENRLRATPQANSGDDNASVANTTHEVPSQGTDPVGHRDEGPGADESLSMHGAAVSTAIDGFIGLNQLRANAAASGNREILDQANAALREAQEASRRLF